VADDGPYKPKETDGDLEKVYKDLMNSIDKMYTGSVNKDPKKDPKGGG
jgi:hypothetical protein